MKIWKTFCKFARLIFLCGLPIIWNYFAWMLPYSRHPERIPLEKRYGKLHKIVVYVVKKLRINPQIEGREYFDSHSPCLIVANHQSMVDILAMIALSEKPISFVAKKETEKFPFVGKCIRIIEAVFLDRNDLRQAVKTFRTVEENIKTKNLSYLIYPEGTRNKDPQNTLTLPFHAGSFKIAMRTGSPILPLAEYGTFRVIGKGINDRNYFSQFAFLPPITSEEYQGKDTGEISSLCQERINQKLGKMKEEDALYIEKRLHKKKAPKWWKKDIVKGN